MSPEMMEMFASLINRIDALEEEVKKLKKREPAKRFAKPGLHEIAQEFFNKGAQDCNGDAESFYNHYESNGWMVGKAKMKNWKATVAQWAKRNKGNVNGQDQSKAISGRAAITFTDTDF